MDLFINERKKPVAINTLYGFVFTLKMESVPKITIFGLKMTVKSGIEKFILKSLNAGYFVTEFCAKLVL